jgi:hypothetical protein
MSSQSVGDAAGSEAEGTQERSFRQAFFRRVTNPKWLARASAVGLCCTALGFVIGVVVVLSTAGQLTLIMMPPRLQALFAVPYLVLLFGVGTVAGAVLGWHRGYWSLCARIHQTLLAILAGIFLWRLASYGLLG